jgi:phage/plasmid-like protein (TIGR03299 family)
MPHEVDLSTGGAAMAYVGQTPWHRLGEKLEPNQPIEVWLKSARLEWTLKRLPVQYLWNGQLQTMDDRFTLVRSDTGEALSVVSGDYRIVQPMEVLEFYRDLVSVFGYTLETAGALNNGRKIWALARTGITGSVDRGGRDEMEGYLLLATSCDKTLATTAAFTSVRVVCANTLSIATNSLKGEKRPHVKVPHTFKFDPKKVKEELGLLDESWNSYLATVRQMAEHKMNADDASVFFADLLGDKDDKPLSAKTQQERETLVGLFTSAPGQQLATAAETLWGAVNAVTYYADHVKKGAADRLDSAWFGSGNALKNRAWAAASERIASANPTSN